MIPDPVRGSVTSMERVTSSLHPGSEPHGPALARVRAARGLAGTLVVAGDKSIAHRAAMLAAAAGGRVVLENYAPGRDAASTLACLQALGTAVSRPAPGRVVLDGPGIGGWRPPASPLDAGNSGTTMRLLLGLLASRPFAATLTGDESLRRRPMGRVVEPLRRMGARITGRDGGRLAPLTVHGGALQAIHHDSPVASAQVKSAILLAGLFAAGRTSVREPALSRDHTERLLPLFGIPVERDGLTVAVRGGGQLRAPERLVIPGDPSAAAFYLAAAVLCPDSRVTLQGVGVNPTRTGFLEVLAAMGARLQVAVRDGAGSSGTVGGRAPVGPPSVPASEPSTAGLPGEPVADLTAETSALEAVEIAGDLIPRLIDEIPVLAVLATQARGTTRIRDAAELRVKETDRLAALAAELRKMGARVTEHPDGLDIEGPTPLQGAVVSARGDHRMAMALAVAGLVAAGETVIVDAGSAAVSDPAFFANLRRLGAPVAGPPAGPAGGPAAGRPASGSPASPPRGTAAPRRYPGKGAAAARAEAKARRLAVLGHPIGHSLSPVMQAAAFRAAGLPWSYTAWDVPPGDLAAALAQVRSDPAWAGVNLTIPHKEAVLPLLDRVDPAARRLGAVNTVVREDDGTLVGYNTDGAGFLRDLEEHGLPAGQLAGRRALILGAGGAARAVAFALLDVGMDVILANRTEERAAALARDLERAGAQGRRAPGPRVQVLTLDDPRLPAVAAGCWLVVNATSAGMPPQEGIDPLPATCRPHPGQVFYDLVYRPAVTPFLARAAAAGARAIGGLGMLLHQGAAAFEHWTNRPAPVAAMRAALEAALAGRDAAGTGPAPSTEQGA